jgi:hypothetical protein
VKFNKSISIKTILHAIIDDVSYLYKEMEVNCEPVSPSLKEYRSYDVNFPKMKKIDLENLRKNRETELTALEGTFEWALIQMKGGKKLLRKHWNGKGQYVFISMPEERGDPLEDHFRICTYQQKVNTWVPSASELLANDWIL